MLVGGFTSGRPYLRGRLFIPSLQVRGDVVFLVDTGSDGTSLHPGDALRLRIPFGRLANPHSLAGIGGAQTYFSVASYIAFRDGDRDRVYAVPLAIALPRQENLTLPSLLGQDILQSWQMLHDPAHSRLEFLVHSSDLTL